MGLIHDHIMARVEGSTPQNDLRQLGFDPDALYEEVAMNPLLTYGLLDAADGDLAKYAMTWLSLGATLLKEKSGRPDDIPTLPDEPDG